MYVSVSAKSRSGPGSKICSKHIDDRLAKRQAPRLVANERAEQVARFEERSYRGTYGFLSLSQINASCNFSRAPQIAQFFFDCPREEHPPIRRNVLILKY
jgi:hypothetical protein